MYMCAVNASYVNKKKDLPILLVLIFKIPQIIYLYMLYT